jgi:hypothetical protein
MSEGSFLGLLFFFSIFGWILFALTLSNYAHSKTKSPTTVASLPIILSTVLIRIGMAKPDKIAKEF